MQKSHIDKILAIGVIILFIGVGIHPVFAVGTKQSNLNKDEIPSENIEYIQSGNKLTRNYLIPLIINYYYELRPGILRGLKL